MNKMIPSDGQGITISHGYKNFQLWLTQLYTGSAGKSPSMHGMQGVKINITGDPG